MERSEQARRWICELLRVPPEPERPGEPVDVWPIVDRALTAVHAASLDPFSEPALALRLEPGDE
ncbi:MAG: hypothetical protein HYV08_16080 [Deltaproteobacteria bacterium]|nr:hypothetical protein [Deltaproteobacteria bacterium]MBI3079400.1 hypothetical protein [Deltaproteobacteria bacterium]